MSQPVLLNLPDDLYARVKEAAQQTQRSLEAELMVAVAKGLPTTEKLSADHEQALASLELLDDKALIRAARSHLSKKASSKIEKLHRKRSLEGLTSDENENLEALIHQYEHFMLIRAKAAALLHTRGYNVDVLIKQT